MDGLNENFLIECMKENLAHARHIENERMMFNSLFAVLVGGALAVVSQLDDKIIIIVILGILMIIDIICFIFTKRWNKVFKNHYALAKNIYIMFLNKSQSSTPQDTDQKHPDINCFYYFDNQLDKKKYISTGQYFIIYNFMVFVLLLCSMCYFLS